MAEDQSLTAREAVREVLASEHADVLRESVALMIREIMELEVAQLAGAELGELGAGPQAGAAQRLSGAAVGYAGWGDRAADPEAADGQLSPELSRAAPARGAGAGRCGPGGVCQRPLDPEGRSSGGVQGPVEGSGLVDVPRVG